MLTLSIHLNHLVAWVSSVFSVALAYTYFQNEQTPAVFVTILTAINAAISCASGFWISSYLIRRLEESLS
jgi:hypothetical protein